MEFLSQYIKPRPENSHKGTFGTLKLLCGSNKYTGAALLCCEGALRSGCGLVKLYTQENVALPVRVRLPEVIVCHYHEFKESKANAAVIGCGISDEYENLLSDILEDIECPCVIDADGINYIAKNINILRKTNCNVVLTPHPMEFSRLTGIDVDTIQRNRVTLAEEFSRQYGCTLVLKGHGTVIATPDNKTVINTSGNSALSKGGSGDVLAGVIGSLLAQGYDPHTAAVLAVYSHGKAGDILSQEYGCSGVLPSDLPKVIGKLLG
ncbi:MAG: NAD(P)H-hydrate dehydratase [Clostridia bacterium]|nr:NAD(P)H-hydrate dehydratase [Clostridia bacterium]